jgi:hypothetical protein
MPAGTSTENGDMIRNHESYSMESGDKTENMNTLQDYESYGIVYHPKDGYWYYNDQIIGIFIDTKKPIIYFNNSGSIYLSIAENSENGVMEQKLKLLILFKVLLFPYSFRKFSQAASFSACRLFYLHIKNIFNTMSIQVKSLSLNCTRKG